jgi:hypothetical protein
VQAAARVAAWTVSSSESVCRNIQQRIAQDPWEGWGEINSASRQSSFDFE